MINEPQKSPIVVISWWSNCLALECLQRLTQFTRDRKIFLVQVGKSDEQKWKMRQVLPPCIVELDYPPDSPAEHSRIIRHIVKESLSQETGLWFFDHDLFLLEAIENWLHQVETEIERSYRILVLPQHEKKTPSITIPLFWISPKRWPGDLEGFDPVPFNPQLSAIQPYQISAELTLRLPRMDTLEEACGILENDQRVAFFPMYKQLGGPFPSFPAYQHLGGLNLFSNSTSHSISELNPNLQNWICKTTQIFSKFFTECPEDWLEIEDPALLNRLSEYRELINEN